MIFSYDKKPKHPGYFFITYLNTMSPRVLIVKVEIPFRGIKSLVIWDKNDGYFDIDDWDDSDVAWGDEIIMPKVEFKK